MSTTMPTHRPRGSGDPTDPPDPLVAGGPGVLLGLEAGPSLAAHRSQYGEVPRIDVDELIGLTDRVRLRGRGGAAFPFATKLRTVAGARGRPTVVVNLSEGEPASAKDAALALTRPHLILDGAVAVARALKAREIHVVVGSERAPVATAIDRAIDERDDRVRIVPHLAEPSFVAGQERAVLQLMAGRPNLPVTAWAPAAVSGHRDRPTLLSNAETWAQLGRLLLVGEREYRRLGTASEPGTSLLTVTAPGGGPVVVEVPYGTRLRDVEPPLARGRAHLIGGFHGAWATWETIASARVSVDGLRALGSPLGAGIVLGVDECPVTFTAGVVAYLAGQSAGRCGPCRFGLPALAEALDDVSRARGAAARVEQLAGLVSRRGACAHPDGTARLVRSLLSTFESEVALHAAGGCSHEGA